MSQSSRRSQARTWKKFEQLVNDVKSYHLRYKINIAGRTENIYEWLKKADYAIKTKNLTQPELKDVIKFVETDMIPSMKFFGIMVKSSPKQQKRRQRSPTQRQRSRKQRYKYKPSYLDNFS